MKLWFATLVLGTISINASDLNTKLLKPIAQAATVNLRYDQASNTLVAHHHFKNLAGYYDTIVIKSLYDNSVTIKSYKSSIKAGAIVPALSREDHQAIVDLLTTRIEITQV